MRSQGRKIILSSNLPNVGDLEDALIRPGRCFARIYVRTLTSKEAQALAADIAAGMRGAWAEHRWHWPPKKIESVL